MLLDRDGDPDGQPDRLLSVHVQQAAVTVQRRAGMARLAEGDFWEEILIRLD